MTDVFKQQAGQDITKPLNTLFATKDKNTVNENLSCLRNAFVVANTDFRKTARCQVQNDLLLVFSSILIATIAAKCMSP